MHNIETMNKSNIVENCSKNNKEDVYESESNYFALEIQKIILNLTQCTSLSTS